MTTTDSTTRRTVRAYHDARYRGDVQSASEQLGDGFTFRSPFIESASPTGHLAGMEEFLKIVTRVEMISELYGDTDAVLIYNVHTDSPVGTQRTAEHFRMDAGRITAITLIFDATPWQAIMATRPQDAGR
ncbi:hypothetical protein GFY24_33595 [Nocardia sp. SYP-A9097]|uniref:hypothetical protein n=1 Tax=Nocardia sp. SYP-A9097 TaxID=2663237 RepID=UPI00129A788E|nr:hypothetical protein [Nocardia sp. SYP-A9097]MRH92312.1 hypothetical protein [Nocardia sp. SYP-A9097]